MKKITIIFIIVICLLSFMGISCLAEETSSPGETWNKTLSIQGKVSYIMGFNSGIVVCAAKLDTLISEDRGFGEEIDYELEIIHLFMDLRESLIFINEHMEAILEVMEGLYKDPANTYIILAPMIEIACQKLKGEDVGPLLQEARKDAL